MDSSNSLKWGIFPKLRVNNYNVAFFSSLDAVILDLEFEDLNIEIWSLEFVICYLEFWL